MANEWRALALTVLDTLMEAYSNSGEATRLIDLAIVELEAQHRALRLYNQGLADVAPGPAGVLPIALLEDARRHIKRSVTLLFLADDTLFLCCEGTGFVLSVEMMPDWGNPSIDASRHGDEAQMCLRNGVSFVNTADDAVDMAPALQLPAGVRVLSDWLLAAEELQNKAIDEVSQARHHARVMRDALSRQLVVAVAWSFRDWLMMH